MKIFDVLKKKKISPAPKEKKVEIKREEIKKEKIRERKGPGRAYKILIKPLITEKSSFLNQYNQHVFEIDSKANKIEVAKAFESVYKIKPISVNVIKVKGKEIRYGRVTGRTKNWKKAVITLKPGEKIAVHEGV